MSAEARATYPRAVHLLVALAWPAAAVAIGRRWRIAEPTSGAVETVVVATASTLILAGLVGVLLGALGRFSAPPLAVTGAILAALLWPRGQALVPRPAPQLRAPAIALVVIVLGGLALRAPLHSAALAGRDQGTYVLRAQHLLRSGGFQLRDPVLAAAGAAPESPGSIDLLGLYPTDGDPWRQGIYEGAYRPGLYLTDRESGSIAPQFLHMHPTLLAIWGIVFGPSQLAGILYLYAALSILAIAAVAARLWPQRRWAAPLAAALLATMPLVIWVQRTPLTEALVLPLGLSALLVALASRRDWITAVLLGSLGWIRGNAWLAAPLVLAVLWFRRAEERRSGPLLYGLALTASLILHAYSVFPYLYDELHRQLGDVIALRPPTLVVLPLAGLALWALVDRLIATPLRSRFQGLRRQLPRLLIIAGAAAIGIFLVGQPTPLQRPFSRLDPALAGLSLPLLVAAGLGALRLLLRPPVASTWTLALSSLPATTLLLYSQRNLPQAGLFYYGRYLTPELAPLAILLAVYALLGLVELVERRVAGRRIQALLRVLPPTLLLGAVSLPLVLHPIVRVQEHAGSERMVEAIAAALPRGAIVLAGGEGWHSSHAFNQVGGALVLGHDVGVLPYRSAEVAYATLHALLVDDTLARPSPPRVFLLLGEASHAYTRESDGALIAAIDDLLPPPFRARPVGLYELYTDRLTPEVEAVPTRVTRSALRLGLFEVVVDPTLRAPRSWRFADGESVGDGPLPLKKATWRGGHLCLDPKRDLTITLPDPPDAAALVLEGAPGEHGSAAQWQVRLGKKRRADLKPPPRVRERGTLGPIPLNPDADEPTRSIRVRGSSQARGSADCPHGQLRELRLLPRPSASASPRETIAQSWAPPRDLGHPPKRATWVRGRSLSRLRPGIRPAPKLDGLSLVLEADEATTFPRTELPPGPGVWIAHLTRLRDGPTSLELRVDGALLVDLALPQEHTRSWQSPPIPWSAGSSAASVTITLRGPPGAAISLRDLAFFSDEPLANSP